MLIAVLGSNVRKDNTTEDSKYWRIHSVMLKIVLKYAFALIFLFSGSMHFISLEFFVTMIPDYLPFPRALVCISGVFEIIFGAGLLVPKYQNISAWGLIAVLIAVFPANIHMYMRAEQFSQFSETALLLRLPIQGLLVYWAWLYTGGK